MRTIKFIGVSTAGSLIHEVFPRWARVLGVDAGIVGVDVPRDASPARFREVVGAIRADGDCLGAVITSHKTALFRGAAGDFESLDALARSCREINAVRSDAGGLHGYARDPISVGRVVDEIWPELDADLLCFGSGGTAIALARHLIGRGQRGRMRFIDRSAVQARHFAEIVADGRSTVEAATVEAATVEAATIEAAQGPYDAMVAAARPGTLVVNATGAGKDQEGSPVTDDVRFPGECVFWDLNYRGDLRMLAAARAQAADRALRVHDGMSLFCHGWAAALTAVLGLPENPLLAEDFAREVR